MQAEKAGRGQSPSNSLRTSQRSTTRLSDSAKLIGTLTHLPDSPEENVSASMQLPSDGTGDSLSVRPATKHAVQVFGSLSRVGRKLRESDEAQANKRTQSQAGIGEEAGDNRSASKRQRTDGDAAPSAPAPGKAQGHPVSQPAPQAVVQTAVHPAVQPAVQPVPRPIPQPVTQGLIVQPVPVFSVTPDMRAQIDMAEALRMAKSITPFQPEKISELFEHLCRSQLWPLLKLEEQRALYLMNLQSVLPVSYGVPSGAVAGRVMMVDAPSSSTTTTATTMQPVSPTPIPLPPIPVPAPMARAVQSALPERGGRGKMPARSVKCCFRIPPTRHRRITRAACSTRFRRERNA